MTFENCQQHPQYARMLHAHGYSLPIISDAQWLASTEFSVTKSGRLDRRIKHCWTHSPK